MMSLWLLGLVCAAACTKPNPNRCCADEADCEAKGIAVGSQCDQGFGVSRQPVHLATLREQ